MAILFIKRFMKLIKVIIKIYGVLIEPLVIAAVSFNIIYICCMGILYLNAQWQKNTYMNVILAISLLLSFFIGLTYNIFQKNLKFDLKRVFTIIFTLPFVPIVFVVWLFNYIIYYIKLLCNKLYGYKTIPFKSMIEYEQLLTDYFKNNKFIELMENKNIKMYFNTENVIRILNKNSHALYELKTKTKENKEVMITIWGIIQMFFNDYTTFNGIKLWANLIDNIKIVKLKI